MRVEAGPDAARAGRHVSTCRPDISGTFPYDLSLLRHRVCCREQHDGTDCKNNLLHKLSSGCFGLLRAIAKGRRSVLGMLMSIGVRWFGQQTCCHPLVASDPWASPI